MYSSLGNGKTGTHFCKCATRKREFFPILESPKSTFLTVYFRTKSLVTIFRPKFLISFSEQKVLNPYSLIRLGCPRCKWNIFHLKSRFFQIFFRNNFLKYSGACCPNFIKNRFEGRLLFLILLYVQREDYPKAPPPLSHFSIFFVTFNLV